MKCYRLILGAFPIVLSFAACAPTARPVHLQPYEKVTVVYDDDHMGAQPFEFSTWWEKCDLLGLAVPPSEGTTAIQQSDLQTAESALVSGDKGGQCLLKCRGQRYVAPCQALSLNGP